MSPQTETKNKKKTFEYSTKISATVETVTRFHEKPAALTILTPPPLIVKINNDQRVSLTEGSLDFTLWFGPIPVRWVARHEPGPEANSFIDRMMKGPMTYWEHQHIFRESGDGVELVDKLTFQHPDGWRGLLTRLFFDGPGLRFLFWYRHWRTEQECRKMDKSSSS